MSYIGQHVREGQAVRTSYTASGGESSVNVTYTIGQLSVFLNGVKLVENVDYTAQNGISVTSISPTLVADDVMEFIALDTFTAADMVPASTGGTFLGDVSMDKNKKLKQQGAFMQSSTHQAMVLGG